VSDKSGGVEAPPAPAKKPRRRRNAPAIRPKRSDGKVVQILYNPDVHPRLAAAYFAHGGNLREFSRIIHAGTDCGATIGIWMKKHPEFREAVVNSKQAAIRMVAGAMIKSAVGHVGPDNRYHRPDVTAQIFYLKNRDRDNWRDVNQLEVSGNFIVEAVDWAKIADPRSRPPATIDVTAESAAITEPKKGNANARSITQHAQDAAPVEAPKALARAGRKS